MTPKEWIPSLFTYGPFAILPLLVFVVERILQSRKKHAEQAEKKTYRMLYLSNWIVILGSIVYCVIFWTLTYGGKAEIMGTIENLSNNELLNSTQADLYLHKKYKHVGFSDYQWRLVSDKKFPEKTKVSVTIAVPKPRATPKPEDVGKGCWFPPELDPDLWQYKLPIESYFYEDGVVLKRKRGKLFLEHNGTETELEGELLESNELPKSEVTGASWTILPVAHAQVAQASFSKEDFIVGLESPDIIARRRARAELANQDPAVTLPFMNETLTNKGSSYRLRLGVIVALNGIPTSRLSADMLKQWPSLVDALQVAVGDPDYTLRNEAVNFLNRYGLVPVILYEHIDARGKAQAYAVGRYRADRKELGNLPNDSASALHVGPGFVVKLCQHEGLGNGGGKCLPYGPGWHKLTPWDLADQVSYIAVSKKVTSAAQ